MQKLDTSPTIKEGNAEPESMKKSFEDQYERFILGLAQMREQSKDKETWSIWLESEEAFLQRERRVVDIPQDQQDSEDRKLIGNTNKAIRLLEELRNIKPEVLMDISQELELLRQNLPDGDLTKDVTKLLIAGGLTGANQFISNAVEFSVTGALIANTVTADSTLIKAIYGALTAYVGATYAMWGIPSVAGITRYLIYNIPEELIVRAYKAFAETDKTKRKNSPLSLKNMLLTLEGSGIFLLFPLELMRMYNVEISDTTLKFLITYSRYQDCKRKSDRFKDLF